MLGVHSRRKRNPIKPNFNLCHQPPRITELSATVGCHPPPHATDPPNAFLPVLKVVYEPVGGGTGGWRVVWVAHAAATSGVPDGVNQFELDATAQRDCPQPSQPWIPCQQSASDCSMTCEWRAVQWEGDLRVKRVWRARGVLQRGHRANARGHARTPHTAPHWNAAPPDHAGHCTALCSWWSRYATPCRASHAPRACLCVRLFPLLVSNFVSCLLSSQPAHRGARCHRPDLPDAVIATIFAFLPGCEALLPLLSRGWCSDASWRLVSVAAWGRRVLLDKQRRDADLMGVVALGSDPAALSWRRYFCQRRARSALAVVQRRFDPVRVLRHVHITPDMRERLVDWMIEVCDSMASSERVVHMAVELVDMHVSASPAMAPQELQLAGAAALLVALEVRAPSWCCQLRPRKLQPDLLLACVACQQTFKSSALQLARRTGLDTGSARSSAAYLADLTVRVHGLRLVAPLACPPPCHSPVYTCFDVLVLLRTVHARWMRSSTSRWSCRRSTLHLWRASGGSSPARHPGPCRRSCPRHGSQHWSAKQCWGQRCTAARWTRCRCSWVCRSRWTTSILQRRVLHRCRLARRLQRWRGV